MAAPAWPFAPLPLAPLLLLAPSVLPLAPLLLLLLLLSRSQAAAPLATCSSSSREIDAAEAAEVKAAASLSTVEALASPFTSPLALPVPMASPLDPSPWGRVNPDAKAPTLGPMLLLLPPPPADARPRRPKAYRLKRLYRASHLVAHWSDTVSSTPSAIPGRYGLGGQQHGRCNSSQWSSGSLL